MRILIADDDPDARRLLQLRLSKWGYEVEAAIDGAEAWEILQRDDAPRLAVLDWMMPGMDGIEVCRKVRERHTTPYVYIIVLTARSGKEALVEGMDAGADDYLTKPFHPLELQARLRAGQRIVELETALQSAITRHREAEEGLFTARKREVEMGAKIQQTLLLGRPPEGVPGIQVAALTVPSQQIDGDFFDFLTHNDLRLDIIIGDVMGKGIPAALFGAAIKSHFLRALSELSVQCQPGQLPQPEAIVGQVHASVTRQFIGLDSFETLCYARFDLEERRLDFVDCGHPPTIHYRRREGACTMLQSENMPLGASEKEVYKQITTSFEVGDIFFFYSDGVIEAKNVAGELFGVDRLVQLIQQGSHLSPDELIGTVRGEVVAFSGSEKFADDLTCIAVSLHDH